MSGRLSDAWLEELIDNADIVPERKKSNGDCDAELVVSRADNGKVIETAGFKYEKKNGNDMTIFDLKKVKEE